MDRSRIKSILPKPSPSQVQAKAGNGRGLSTSSTPNSASARSSPAPSGPNLNSGGSGNGTSSRKRSLAAGVKRKSSADLRKPKIKKELHSYSSHDPAETNNQMGHSRGIYDDNVEDYDDDDEQDHYNDNSNGNEDNHNTGSGKSARAGSGSGPTTKNTGHRPVTSCTFCRQHKIKCNASENFPNPCSRCDRMALKCEIDPQFRPKKGSQIQSLKSDVDELKAKIEMLTKNETLLTQALTQQNLNFNSSVLSNTNFPSNFSSRNFAGSVNNDLTSDVGVLSPSRLSNSHIAHDSSVVPVEYSPNSSELNHNPDFAQINLASPQTALTPSLASNNGPVHTNTGSGPLNIKENSDNSPQSTHNSPVIDNFVLGDICLPLQKANELHDKFAKDYLPFLPIFNPSNATDLYYKSQLLFWSVILTASLSEPEPSLYMNLSSLIKQLAIETCWIRTPRSTHVIQALIILSVWPLPNEKVLDDCSYRFVGLAKNLSLQLGLHRGGDFIKEFSRTQVSLGPDSEKWRTRSWLAVFFCEQFWSSTLGLPPSITTTDYLLEHARIDQELPKNFRCLISLSIFQCKLVNVMGISVTTPDGLLEPSNRAGSLNMLDRELDRLKFKLQIEDDSIEIYFLYIKLMLCGFAFLPGTPIEDQVKYVSQAYLSSTRIITLISQMINSKEYLLIELPIYIRQALTYSVLILFKLHLSKYLLDRFVDSARQSIVTVHRLLRNTLSSWKDLQNDISRTAKVLENLNIVLYSYPEIFINEEDTSIISRMRSHLTASLFYDLVWCVHEARRRTLHDKQLLDSEREKIKRDREVLLKGSNKRVTPLPFYNQITKDDFKTIITTTPNGTTVTTLVPTDQAMSQAKQTANKSNSVGKSRATLKRNKSTGKQKHENNNDEHGINDSNHTNDNKDKFESNYYNNSLQINGIPLSMLEATGSINDKKLMMSPPRHGDNYSNQNLNLQTPNANQNTSMNIMNNNNNNSTNNTAPGAESNAAMSPNVDPSNPMNNEIFNQNLLLDNPGVGQNFNSNSPVMNNQLDNFFQQQSNGWINSDNFQDDDFLGWFDTNMMN